MNGPTKHFYDFGPFRFDPEELLLLRDGRPVPLAPKVVETLSLLLQSAGHLVEKDELLKRVWPDAFVEEGNLNKNIFLLRKVLGQREGGGEYIETVPKRGYRFVASVSQAVEEKTNPHPGTAASNLAGKSTSPQSLRDRHRNILLAHGALLLGGLVVAAVAVAVGAWFVRDHGSGAVALAPVQLTSELGAAGQPSFSPDGNQIVYCQAPENGDTTSLYVKIIGVPGPPRRLTTQPGIDFSPAWSPDGSYIAFLRYNPDAGPKAAVLRLPLTGGPEQTLADVSIWDAPSVWPVPDLAWFPDGQSLITVDCSSPDGPCGLFLLSVDTREKRKLTMPLPGAENDATPAVSPDGRWLAFSRGAWGVMHLYLVELGNDHRPRGEPRQITFEDGQQTNPVWTPDGREIMYVSGVFQNAGLWRVAVSAGHPGKPERVAFAGNEVHDLAISKTGRRLVFSRGIGGGYQIWRVEASVQRGRASQPVKLISSTQTDEDPAYSPDGKRIAFKSARSGNAMEIWVCDSDGSNATQLTFSAAGVHNWFPRWSPDGRSILFSSNRGGHNSLYLINSQGGTPKRLSADESGAGTFSQDGKWIYFVSDRTGQSQIWKMPANGSDGKAVQVTRNGAVKVIESPNGKYLYGVKDRNPSPLVKVSVEGGEETQVLPSVFYGNFTVADDGIYFIPAPTHDGFSLEFVSFSTGKTAHIAKIGEQGPGYALEVSPGRVVARSILYEQERPENWNLMLVENFR